MGVTSTLTLSLTMTIWLPVSGCALSFLPNPMYPNTASLALADDYCALQMKFDDNVYGSVVLNTHMPGMYEQEILLVGTAGRLRLRNTQLFGYKKGITDGVCACAHGILWN